MKTWIDIQNTCLDFTKFALVHTERTKILTKNNMLASIPDFCTIIVNFHCITDTRWHASVIDSLGLEARKAPVFVCLGCFSLAHILKALGAFQSVGDAKRNGWDKLVPEGIWDHQVRINKVKGIITTFKPTEAMLVPGSWDNLSREE